MSNLKTILDRLVQENLHGPTDHGNQDGLKSHAARQATAAAAAAAAAAATTTTTDALGQGRRNNNSHPQRTHWTHDEDGDMDSHDPRWRQLFHEFFLSEHSDDRNDDLLFFVQRASQEVENGGLGGEDPVFVKRNFHHKSSFLTGDQPQPLLTPEQELAVLWKDTFFLNVIVQLPCKLTVAICSRIAETNPTTGITKTSMTCTRKHVSKRVYALPTKSRVDVKEATVECSWPLIYYVIDDYEDMFEQVMVQENEYLCVELAVTLPSAPASSTKPTSPITSGAPLSSPRQHRSRPGLPQESQWNQTLSSGNDGPQVGKPFPSTTSSSGRGRSGSSGGSNKITLFQGAAGFQSLLGIYQQKAASKVGRRFKFGPHTVPTEFVMMRGPGGRGHAQVAITASNVGDDSPLAFAPSYQPETQGHIQPTPTPTPPHGQLSSVIHNGNSPRSLTKEKTLPPIPGGNGYEKNDSDSHDENHHHRQQQQHHHYRQRPEKIDTSALSPTQQQPNSSARTPPPNSPPKSFSTGSFFQSLRRISLATLAQAAAAAPSPSPSAMTSSSSTHSLSRSPNSMDHPHPTTPLSPTGRRTGHDSPGNTSTSGVSASGVGTRQEVEALVKQPQSLKCCMTFVNVPWTGIASMLMDHAYSHRSTALAAVQPKHELDHHA